MLRPAVCGETVFNFATAAAFGAWRAPVDRASGATQFGARRQAEAGQMIGQLSAALELAPNEVSLCTDERSAVGSVIRPALPKAAIDGCKRADMHVGQC